jgi:hypothetical protein
MAYQAEKDIRRGEIMQEQEACPICGGKHNK